MGSSQAIKNLNIPRLLAKMYYKNDTVNIEDLPDKFFKYAAKWADQVHKKCKTEHALADTGRTFDAKAVECPKPVF